MRKRERESKKRTILITAIFLALTFALLSGLLYIGAKLNSFEMRRYVNNVLIKNSLYIYLKKNEITKSVITKTNELPISCPTEYKSIAIFGQSNSANRIPRKNGLRTIADGKTYMYDWVNGICYNYAEPLVGTDGEGRGNILTTAIENYRKSQPNGNILVIAFGRGGSSVFSWSHGIESIRYKAVLDSVKSKNIRIDTAFWHQGESDAILEIYFPEKLKAYGTEIGMRQDFYNKSLNAILDKLTNFNPNIKIGVAIASICKNNGSDEIREAQRMVISSRPNIYKSTDSDKLGSNMRYDDCHFNELGEKYIAEDYYQFLKLTLN